jgi:hypothetical protein
MRFRNWLFGALLAATQASIALPLLAGPRQLETRPSDPVGFAQVEMFSTLADQVGWGTLRETEHMRLAHTVYGADALMAVTGVPYFPLTFYLQSRDWAFQRLLGLDEADAHLEEIYVDPAKAMQVDLLLIADDESILSEAVPRVSLVVEDGRSGPPTIVDLTISAEPALGGFLYAGRATVQVAFPPEFSWEETGGFSLLVELGDLRRVLTWQFAG